MVVDDIDRQVWTLVSNVPLVVKPVAFVCAFLNVFIPGFGTLIAACAADDTVSKTQLAVGFVQFFTSFIIVGWLFSIYWGYLIVMKALNQ